MKDFQARIEKLLSESIECDLIASSATDLKKRALFERLARDYREIARDFEKMALIGEVSSDDAALLPGTGLF